ncbi:MAG: hypothetical protein KDA45_04985 [Planctomycetales bacterium]|nr:hypothetical protein [Planctomycetales bacterium]
MSGAVTCCRVCGRFVAALGPGTAPSLCSSPYCHRWRANEAHAERISERWDEREKRRQDLAEQAVAFALQRQPDLPPEGLGRVVVLPYQPRRLEPPAAERLQRVEAILLDLATDAQRQNAAETLSHPEENVKAVCDTPAGDRHAAKLPDIDSSDIDSSDSASQCGLDAPAVRFAHLTAAACGTCRGLCCRLGGDNGFLNAAKFRAVLRERPGETPQDVVADYMRHIPDRTCFDSCIFHGKSGCGLPRDYRAITCNTYLCTSLKALRGLVEENVSRLLLAATNLRDDAAPEVYQITVVDNDDVQPLPPLCS